MATLLITELPGEIGTASRRPVVALPPLAEQSVTFSTTTQSAALGSGTYLVRLIADASCRIKVGANPTALVTGSLRLAADCAEYFAVQPGAIIAVVAG